MKPWHCRNYIRSWWRPKKLLLVSIESLASANASRQIPKTIGPSGNVVSNDAGLLVFKWISDDRQVIGFPLDPAPPWWRMSPLASLMFSNPGFKDPLLALFWLYPHVSSIHVAVTYFRNCWRNWMKSACPADITAAGVIRFFWLGFLFVGYLFKKIANTSPKVPEACKVWKEGQR